jgi:ubiquinone/menaquinone biosynthesis C-methylase UbiE
MIHLTPALQKAYTQEKQNAREAQRLAEFIAFGPIVFQVSRLMVKWGILDLLRDAPEGLTRPEIVERTGLTDYAVGILLDSSLTIGTILINQETERYSLSKAGWFLLTDTATRANLDFNHDVNYIGMFRLEEALREGRPAGLEHFGPWPTIYEALSSLPKQVQKSWFGFDHFYSDHSFDEALKIVIDQYRVRTLLDVGGNTGRWALRCVAYHPEVRVTLMDLPQQIEMMRRETAGKPGAERIDGIGINLLDAKAQFPAVAVDAIWMSQFLDCFSMEEITSILTRAGRVMTGETRLFIMETLWDRQKYEPAAFCLTQTSVYFTALANGNSKMYHTRDLEQCITEAGLTVEQIHDNLGQGHSILVCRKKS